MRVTSERSFCLIRNVVSLVGGGDAVEADVPGSGGVGTAAGCVGGASVEEVLACGGGGEVDGGGGGSEVQAGGADSLPGPAGGAERACVC